MKITPLFPLLFLSAALQARDTLDINIYLASTNRAPENTVVKKIQDLIADGADINVQDGKGNTPLHNALNLGYKTVAKILITTPGVDTTIANGAGQTALMIAEEQNMQDIVNLLKPAPQPTRAPVDTSIIRRGILAPPRA